MGWTSFKLNEPVKQWFINGFGSDKARVLDVAIVKRNTLYAAVRNVQNNEVICFVYLLRWSMEYYNFSYKDMTEFCGPCENECPERILKLLTPLTGENDSDEWARNWRKRCYSLIEKRKTLKGNCIIETDKAIRFNNGDEFQHFKKVGTKIYAGSMYHNEFKESYRVRINLSKEKFTILK